MAILPRVVCCYITTMRFHNFVQLESPANLDFERSLSEFPAPAAAKASP